MTPKTQFMATLLAAALLTGCDGLGPKPKPSATTIVAPGTNMCIPPALAPPPTQCAPLQNTKANTCEIKGNNMTCHVLVGVTGNVPFVYPYTLEVPVNSTSVKIVWTVLDDNLWFSTPNDGPCFTKAHSNGRFKEGHPTHDHGGGPGIGTPAKHFTLKLDGTGGSHDYKIRFKRKNPIGVDQVLECDPTINNSAG